MDYIFIFLVNCQLRRVYLSMLTNHSTIRFITPHFSRAKPSTPARGSISNLATVKLIVFGVLLARKAVSATVKEIFHKFTQIKPWSLSPSTILSTPQNSSPSNVYLDDNYEMNSISVLNIHFQKALLQNRVNESQNGATYINFRWRNLPTVTYIIIILTLLTSRQVACCTKSHVWCSK